MVKYINMNYSFLELKKEKNDKKCREGFHRNAGPEFVYPDDPFQNYTIQH